MGSDGLTQPLAPPLGAAQVLGALGVGVVVQDLTTRIVYTNAEAAALLGEPRETLPGRSSLDPDWDVVREDGSPFPLDELPVPVCVRTGAPVRGSILGVRRPHDGDRAWVLVNAMPLRDGEGALVGAVATLTDVSAEHGRGERAELARTRSEQVYAALLGAMTEGVAIHAPGGAILYANPAAERILGLSLDQLRGRAAVDPRWRLVHVDGRTVEASEIPSELTERTGVPCHNVVLGVHRPDGSRAWLSVCTAPIGVGEQAGVVATFKDVTAELGSRLELERANARFAAVSAAVPGVIYQYRLGADGSERFPFVAGRVAEMLGVETRELDVEGARLWSTVHRDDVAGLRAAVARSAAARSPFDHEFRVERPSGVRWMRAQASPEDLGDGLLWTGFARDVTEERALAERMRQLQRREAMHALAAGVAHNFNNMLAVVLPNLQALRDAVEASGGALLEDAISATERAAELVRQLMYVVRGDAGAARVAVDTRQVAAEVVALCRGSFDRLIQLVFEDTARRATTFGDPTLLHQALLNLCINARDALAGVAAPRILVRLGYEEPADGRGDVLLSVEDNGAGMDEEVQRRLGEVFFTTKAPGVGTGLGVATVIGTVRAMGGSFEVRSAPGAGTRITLRLPAHEASAPAAPIERSVPRLPGVSVLVVDDEPLVRRTLERMLARVGAEVATAADGYEALERVGQGDAAPALVLLDLSMPGLPGREVLARLHDRWPSLPVIVLSGDARDRAGLERAAAIVQKPVGAQKLIDAIVRVLGGSLE